MPFLLKTRFISKLCYACNNTDTDAVKDAFEELYQQMNGMPLREMDKIVYPVCMLCRDHEKAGFVEGIKIGIQLASELE